MPKERLITICTSLLVISQIHGLDDIYTSNTLARSSKRKKRRNFVLFSVHDAFCGKLTKPSLISCTNTAVICWNYVLRFYKRIALFCRQMMVIGSRCLWSTISRQKPLMSLSRILVCLARFFFLYML